MAITTPPGANAGEAGGGSEQPFPSHYWKPTRVMVRRAPQAPANSGRAKRARSYWRSLPRRHKRDALTIVVRWRGGAEAWVEVTARGETNYLPGFIDVASLVLMVNNDR